VLEAVLGQTTTPPEDAGAEETPEVGEHGDDAMDDMWGDDMPWLLEDLDENRFHELMGKTKKPPEDAGAEETPEDGEHGDDAMDDAGTAQFSPPFVLR